MHTDWLKTNFRTFVYRSIFENVRLVICVFFFTIKISTIRYSSKHERVLRRTTLRQYLIRIRRL